MPGLLSIPGAFHLPRAASLDLAAIKRAEPGKLDRFANDSGGVTSSVPWT
jgi:hypothetical protein